MTQRGKTKNMITLVVISLCAGIIYQVPYLKAVFYDALQVALNVSHTELGSLNTIYGVAAMILYIPGGILVDKIRMKYLFPISMIGCGLLVFWFATLPSLRILQLIYLLLAVFSILTFWSARVKVVRFLSTKENYPTNQGVSGSLYALAGLLCSFAAMAFISSGDGSSVADLQRALIFYAVVYTGFGILSFFTIPKFDDEIDTTAKFHIREFVEALKQPGVWVVAMSTFAIYAIQISVPYTTPYLTNIYFAPAVLISAISIIRTYGINVISAPISGFIAKKIGSTGKLMIVFSVCVIAMSTVFLLTPVKESLTVVVIIFSLICAFFATGMNGVAIVQLDEVGVPKRVFGGASGIVSVIGYIPDVFIYTMYGMWLDKYAGATGYNRIFIAMIFWALLSIVFSALVLILGRKRKLQTSED